MTARTGTILVAVGSDTVPELETAASLARLMGAGIQAVRVGRMPADGLETTAARFGTNLRRLQGPAVESLLAALEAPEALAMVVGAGTTRRGRHPVGTTARGVLERARKPVLVVPTGLRPRRPMRRVLLPLEGSETTSRPVRDVLLPLFAADVELEVLHVFTGQTLPRMLDRPARDLQQLCREFLARHCPPATRIEMAPGSVAARVSEACRSDVLDMVVLSWDQDSSRGRARVVREVLGAASLPVLLLPTAAAAGAPPERTARRAGAGAARASHRNGVRSGPRPLPLPRHGRASSS